MMLDKWISMFLMMLLYVIFALGSLMFTDIAVIVISVQCSVIIITLLIAVLEKLPKKK
ncbi:hypothetical protein [Thermaerobacillus caldiproteolyticus]|uniref:hypothetical protein n=1 Tax=Thermaerobacillus caldiproteolyticus TaxID=247480 RepID=UPI00188D117F|nr:hypothetical protein [Anoxybacillus caldiproteolyticus]QPA30567.1 hypothetical protein ISX45_13380 [Anoxybacillus caldiproteolyticus]